MGLLDNFRKKKDSAEQAGLDQLENAAIDPIMEEFLEKPPYEAANDQLTPSGLYPHEIVILDHAGSLFTDQEDFPAFWRTQLGILSLLQILSSLIDRGFLTETSIDATLLDATVQTLKDALKKSGLPVGGKKAELVERLRTSLSEATLYDLFPRRTFSPTWDGIRALDEAMYIPYVQKHPVDGLTIWDIHRQVVTSPEKSYRDLIWEHLERRSATLLQAKDFKAYRNVRYRMYQFYMEENKLKRAFPFLAECMFYDLSGAESLEDPLHRFVSEKYFFPYDKSLVKLSAGNIKAMGKLQADLGLSEEMLKALLMQFFSQLKVPAHLFTVEECAVIILLELRADTPRLRLVYEMAEKRFGEQH